MSKKKNKCPKLCCNCEYWDIMYNEKEWEEQGELACGCCHRYPPYVPSVFIGDVDIASQYGSVWKLKDVLQFEDPIRGGMCIDHPVMFAFDHCGEFSKMKKPRYSWKEYKKDENYYVLTEKGRAVSEGLRESNM